MEVENMISQKCIYALRALFELTLRDTPEFVKVQDIALAQAIPPRFLEVILAELKHGGFVESRRGYDGGYILANPPHALTVDEVINFLQRGIRRTGPADRKRRDLLGDFAFGQMWKKATAAVSDIYSNTTFSALVEQELARQKTYVPNYAI